MRRSLALVLLLALPACAPTTESANLPGVNAEDLPLSIVGLQRHEGKKRLLAGDVADFTLLTRGVGLEEVTWWADAGTVLGDGVQASWFVPAVAEATVGVEVTTADGEVLQASWSLDIEVGEEWQSWAVNPAAVGLVDPTPDSITGCELAIDSNDVPHIVYQSGTHAQLWYATFTGGSWNIEFVDGPGFDVGGLVATKFDFMLDSSNNPHVVYRYQSTGDIRYATPSGASWTREQVNTTYSHTSSSWPMAIALDPINGNRPTVLFTDSTGAYQAQDPVIAYRSGTDTWVETNYPLSSYSYGATGAGLTFTASGVAWVTFDPDDLRVMNWSASQGFFGEISLPSEAGVSFGTSTYMLVELDGANQPIVMTDERIFHRSGGVWIPSQYEAVSGIDPFDLAIDNSGDPRLLVRHGSDLELVQTNPEGYWLYTEIDELDASPAGIAVDTNDNSHACYIKDGQLWFY